MSIDEALSVGVVSPVSFWVFEPSETGAFFLTFTAFLSVRISPCSDLGAIASSAEMIVVDKIQAYRTLHSTGFEYRVDAHFEICESEMVGMLPDMFG